MQEGLLQRLHPERKLPQAMRSKGGGDKRQCCWSSSYGGPTSLATTNIGQVTNSCSDRGLSRQNVPLVPAFYASAITIWLVKERCDLGTFL